MRFFSLIIFLLFFSCTGFAQEIVVYDSDSMATRNFETSAFEKYKADPTFQYEQVVQPSRSLWARFWAWFWDKVNSFFGDEQGFNLLNTVIIILAIGMLVFFILKLTGMSNMGLFGRKSREDKPGYSVVEDDIHGINFDAAIDEAVTDRNFRFAVRLLYLKTLKNLTDMGLINWQVNKTNVAYVDELKGNEYQQNFRMLTSQFENNWYGYLPIGEEEFRTVRNHFNQFNQRLS